jgi:hypothetical protein
MALRAGRANRPWLPRIGASLPSNARNNRSDADLFFGDSSTVLRSFISPEKPKQQKMLLHKPARRAALVPPRQWTAKYRSGPKHALTKAPFSKFVLFGRSYGYHKRFKRLAKHPLRRRSRSRTRRKDSRYEQIKNRPA